MGEPRNEDLLGRLRQWFARILRSTIVGVALMGMVLPPDAQMAAGCCDPRAEAAGKERKPVTKEDVAREHEERAEVPGQPQGG